MTLFQDARLIEEALEAAYVELYGEQSSAAKVALEKLTPAMAAITRVVHEAHQLQKQPNTLNYITQGKFIIVAHPAILPHELLYSDGKWYCYPISPDLERLKGLKL